MPELPIYNKPDGWIVEYPQFSELADKQMHSFWPFDEYEVENDVQDLRTGMTEAELHGLITVLKLFTHYEMFAGDDYWAGRVMSTFGRPEIQRMASMFAAVEMNSHAPFYNKINEVLYLDTPEFYSEYHQSEVLRERMKFIGKMVGSGDDLISLGGFTFIEGAVLYSSFAFIKHFQEQACGKDLIKNICRGINASVVDENLHAVGSATLFRTIRAERAASSEEEFQLDVQLTFAAWDVYEHEAAIVDMIFSKGDIKGITKEQMKDFVKHRVNVCLDMLGILPLFKEDDFQDDTIQKWFYRNINSVQFSDFFSGGGTEYTLNWNEAAFGDVWK